MAQRHPGESRLYRAPHRGSALWASGPAAGSDKLWFSGLGDAAEAAPHGPHCLTTEPLPQGPAGRSEPGPGPRGQPGPSAGGGEPEQTEASSDGEAGAEQEPSRDLEDGDSSAPSLSAACRCQGAPSAPEGPLSEGGDGSFRNVCTCCTSPGLGQDEEEEKEEPSRLPRDPFTGPGAKRPLPRRQRHRLPTKEEPREAGRRDPRPSGRHRPGRKRSQADRRRCWVAWGSEELYRLGQKGFWWLIELLVLVGEYVETGGLLVYSCGQLRGSDLDLLRGWLGSWVGQVGSWAQRGFLCLGRGLCSGAGLFSHLLRFLFAVLLLGLALLLGSMQLSWRVLVCMGDRLGWRTQATWLFSKLDAPHVHRCWTYLRESRTWQQLVGLMQRGWPEGPRVKHKTDRQGDGPASSGRYYQPGEEVSRLLAMAGIPEDELNPFQVLGVEATASDIELKKAYRHLAVMVHPDKNHHPRAEEAFKVLRAAWDIVSNPKRRKEYEMKQMAESELSRSVNEFLSKLQEELKEAMNTMMCSRCQGKHRRFEMDRESQCARYCAECNKMHPAEEGDFWAESSMLGLKITYFAMMDGKVYDITEWAGCQRVGISPDTHRVPYHISFGSRIPGPGGRQRATPDAPPASVADLQDFFSRIFQVPPGQMPNGNFFATSQSGSGATPSSRPDSSTAPKGSEAKPKWRKKVRRPFQR
ncbi:LOW QUALITY PROTEIN: dnaJ homolog subfamily C member 14 [Macrotis lagotis]|uniref:LOW QUALITY PROTEIN: dnaJ homolog subfamily C member 14 n=1 Tax=Macrotis lagotis TaxID=92651 RepID=UPI003D68E87C